MYVCSTDFFVMNENKHRFSIGREKNATITAVVRFVFAVFYGLDKQEKICIWAGGRAR